MGKCPKGKILNPKTGRCVKKNGKIGKEIMRKSRKSTRKPRKSTRKTTKSRKVRSDKGKKRGTRNSRKSPKTTRKSPKITLKTTTLNNLIDEKFLSDISKKIFKFILDEEYKRYKLKFTISTDAKKTIIQIIFTLILKTINIANQKCNNCVISDTHMITAIKSLLGNAYTGKNGLLDNTIRNIDQNINETKGLTKIKDLQKVKDLEGIDILSQFVENNSKHKVDISALIVITTFTTYLFSEAIDIAIIFLELTASIISSFDFIYTLFHDDEFSKLIKKHKILSTPVYNKLSLKFNEHRNFDEVEIRKKLISQITYKTLF